MICLVEYMIDEVVSNYILEPADHITFKCIRNELEKFDIEGFCIISVSYDFCLLIHVNNKLTNLESWRRI